MSYSKFERWWRRVALGQRDPVTAGDAPAAAADPPPNGGGVPAGGEAPAAPVEAAPPPVEVAAPVEAAAAGVAVPAGPVEAPVALVETPAASPAGPVAAPVALAEPPAAAPAASVAAPVALAEPPPAPVKLPVLKAADFASDQDVRWCPGCGDYAILAQMKKMLPSLGVPREKIVFISGIGCSSRFPYYMNTYGIHSIHGRAPAFATGLKAARPDLMVWVITGDGDGLSIGGNHLMHAIRRNLDVNIVLFNNRIYGLTKGQYSPTSPLGKKTKTSPMGAIDNPLHPLSIAIGCEATFVARSIDTHIKHLEGVLRRAAEHRGTAFVEVYQNCNVFNDNAWQYASDRQTKSEHTIELEHGAPLVFGRERQKGIRLNGLEPEVVGLGNGTTEADLLVHDEKASEPSLAYLLSRMRHEDGFPEPIGVFRAIDAPRYEKELVTQVAAARERSGDGDLNALFNSGETWTVS